MTDASLAHAVSRRENLLGVATVVLGPDLSDRVGGQLGGPGALATVAPLVGAVSDVLALGTGDEMIRTYAGGGVAAVKDDGRIGKTSVCHCVAHAVREQGLSPVLQIPVTGSGSGTCPYPTLRGFRDLAPETGSEFFGTLRSSRHSKSIPHYQRG